MQLVLDKSAPLQELRGRIFFLILRTQEDLIMMLPSMLLAWAGLGAPPEVAQQSPYVLPNFYALEVKFGKVEPDPNPSGIVELCIERCLTGQKGVVGKRFKYQALGRHPNDFPQKENKALLLVYIIDFSNVTPFAYQAYLRKYHIDLDIYKEYKFEEWLSYGRRFEQPENVCRIEYLSHLLDMQAWQHAFEQVYARPEAEHQRAALERIARAARLPEIRSWAMIMLSKGPKADAVKFLRQFETDFADLPYDCQKALDEIFCRIDPDRWLNSTLRHETMKRWLVINSNLEFAYGPGYYRIATAFEQGDLDFKTFIKLGEPAHALVEQNKLGESEERFGTYYLCALNSLLFPPRYREEGFDYLTDLVTNSKSSDNRMAAIDSLGQFVPFTAKQRARLEKVGKEHADESVQERVKNLLERVKPLHQWEQRKKSISVPD